MFGRTAKNLLIMVATLLMIISLPLVTACDLNGPSADFTADTTSGAAPLAVSFTEEATGDITSWEWDFTDDGVIDSMEQNPIFTYETPGTYTVVLTVSGPDGEDTLRRTDYIVVNDEPDVEEAQWAAFAFDREVTPAEGESGTVSSFTMRQEFEEDGEVREFLIEGTYEGRAEEEIRVTRIEVDQTTQEMEETVESSQVECYEIRNHITVERDDTDADYPDWIEITVWIPVEDLDRESDFLLVYAKSVYEDADGNTSEWSYYLTEEMRDEMNDPPEGTQVFFLPHFEDDMAQLETQIITSGLYGWVWSLAIGFTIDGEQELEEGTVEWEGALFTISRESRTIGDYVFDAWLIEATIDENDDVFREYRAVISPDLPVPIEFELTVSDADNEDEGFRRMLYELIDLELS